MSVATLDIAQNIQEFQYAYNDPMYMYLWTS